MASHLKGGGGLMSVRFLKWINKEVSLPKTVWLLPVSGDLLISRMRAILDIYFTYYRPKGDL